MRLLDMFSIYLNHESAMPSSLDDLARLGVMPLPDSRQSIITSLRYWATATGRWATAAEPEIEVA